MMSNLDSALPTVLLMELEQLLRKGCFLRKISVIENFEAPSLTNEITILMESRGIDASRIEAETISSNYGKNVTAIEDLIFGRIFFQLRQQVLREGRSHLSLVGPVPKPWEQPSELLNGTQSGSPS
jgi:hypothetical protein